ncbi:MAG: antibiotic biosynthesis monooxygenase [Chloroflexi bacterium]|nr:antibiotic biosynthesis monooxygenase [Chloroflexota bacterium]
MIILKATIFIKPGQRDEFLKHLPEFIEDSRADSGCLEFEVLTDIENPFKFVFLQKWENENTLQGHEHASYVKRFKEAIAGCISHNKQTVIYNVSETRNL